MFGLDVLKIRFDIFDGLQFGSSWVFIVLGSFLLQITRI